MTAATIPRIKAADEPARMDASLEGALVEDEDGVRVAELWVDVVLALVMLCELLLDVKVAELKVEFRMTAVPVPIDSVMPVTVAVELPNSNALVLAVLLLVLLEEEFAEPPLTEKRPE